MKGIRTYFRKGRKPLSAKKLAALTLGVYWGLMFATPAHAGPLAAIVPLVIGAVVKSAVLKLALTVAASLAISALQKKKRPVSPGIMIEQTLNGGTNPRTIIAGLYATAGSNAAPPMSYGEVKKTPNYYLVKVVALADVPVDGISRLILNGEYVPIIPTGGNNYDIGGKYFGKARMTFHDGRQTTADLGLISVLSSYPKRPWTSLRVGTGVSYAVFYFSYDQELYKQEPDIRVELRGMRFYDLRKDSTAGGSGTHRWADPSTWEFTVNNVVIIYNILRGITLPGGIRYGGDCAAEDLPVANWVAGMNVCDETVVTQEGTEPRYRGGFEWSVDDQPVEVIEEFMKGCAAEMVENGGVYKIRVGGPGLPTLFITDDDFLYDKEEELDPFPGINGSVNTIRAAFPHPEEIWQQHDAPQAQNTDYVTQDEGQELVADLAFPAVPYPIQVQRLMLAWLEDDRRWRRHTGTLSHRAFALEPLDIISWTSAHNGYVDKLFDTNVAVCNLYNLQNGIAIREVDPADYDWNSGQELPDAIGGGGWDLPEAQPVEDFVVQAWSIKDEESVDRRAAIRAAWDPGGAVDATGVRIEVRVLGTEALVGDVMVGNIGDAEVIISEGILNATSYEVRARYIVDRPTLWTSWIGVTTGDIRLGEKDLDFDEIIEALGPSIVIPQIMGPAKDGMFQQLIDAAYNDSAVRKANDLQADAFESVFGNTALIRQEAATRLTEDEALTQILTVQISRIDANNAAIIQETTTRATADSALASDISTLTATVVLNNTTLGAAINNEAIVRADADGALGVRIDTVTATAGANTAAISSEALTRANEDTALSGRIDTVSATAGANTAAISAEATARANADTAIANSVTSVSARLDNAGGSGVTVEQGFTAQASAITGLQGQYTLRINVNGRVAGFGLANGSAGSEFTILADRFIVVDPANNSTLAYPFQVVGGVVYIRKALIQQITADQINVTNLQAVSATIGDLDIRPAAGQGGRIRIFDEADFLRVLLGRLS